MTTIRVRVHECTGTIVLENPARRNCLSCATIAELRQAFFDLHQEKRVRAVILTGYGDTFCAGTDLLALQETDRSDNALESWQDEVLQQRELIAEILRFPKPVIAAVNGPAAGLGAALVVAADMAIASSKATFAAPETLRGLVPGLLAPLLVFRFGAAVASRLCLAAETWSAEHAHAQGVYQELVDYDLLWARAHEIGKQCSRASDQAVALTKRLLNETIGESLETWLALGAAATATARTTDAAREGVSAFLQKRAPQW